MVKFRNSPIIQKEAAVNGRFRAHRRKLASQWATGTTLRRFRVRDPGIDPASRKILTGKSLARPFHEGPLHGGGAVGRGPHGGTDAGNRGTLSQQDPKCLAYLSIEFLLGQSLGNNLINLGMREPYRQALQNLGADLAEIEESEDDAALGNGGLGRLAACFLDSLATLGMPGYGYGIHYEYGLFKQEIDNGDQREKPDNWLAERHPLGDRPPG